ncbi:uncharacterized protein [Ptychodera flava]|uniref:uncharacterized protein n=1 Tax=Ptychodera flava TaxID=63121 RepID=UPI003969DD14
METNQSRSDENVDHQREGSCNVGSGRNGQSSALESDSGSGTLTMKDGESGRRTTRYKLAKNGIKDGSSSQGTSKKSETLSGLEKAIMDENNELRERIISHLMENRLPLTNIRRLVKTYSDNDSISVSTRYLCLKNYDLALRKSENNTFRRKIDKLESEIKELKTTVAKQEKMLLEEKRRLEKFRPVDIERRKLIRENEKLQREINAMKGEKANQQVNVKLEDSMEDGGPELETDDVTAMYAAGAEPCSQQCRGREVIQGEQESETIHFEFEI